jgi:hypothetical protein
MTSIDTEVLDFERTSFSSDELNRMANGEEGITVVLENESLAIQELYKVVCELTEKINIIYGAVVTDLRLQDPYKDTRR